MMRECLKATWEVASKEQEIDNSGDYRTEDRGCLSEDRINFALLDGKIIRRSQTSVSEDGQKVGRIERQEGVELIEIGVGGVGMGNLNQKEIAMRHKEMRFCLVRMNRMCQQ